MRFEVYKDEGGYYRWRLIGGNNRKVAASGESFASHSNADAACRNFKAHCSAWAYETYSDTGGHYRWRAKASNGKTVAASGEAFYSQADAKRAAENVRDNGGTASGP